MTRMMVDEDDAKKVLHSSSSKLSNIYIDASKIKVMYQVTIWIQNLFFFCCTVIKEYSLKDCFTVIWSCHLSCSCSGEQRKIFFIFFYLALLTFPFRKANTIFITLFPFPKQELLWSKKRRKSMLEKINSNFF